jgi:arsenate reductase (thioredoxin)
VSDQRQARRRVLLLCTGNSCRSQMAEGLVNALLGDRWEARSAGTAPATSVHPLAVRVMAEVGVDISGARPKHVTELADEPWDLVVTVCDHARETCPVFPRPVPQSHLGFPDPALADGSGDQRLAAFRAVREDMRRTLLPAIAALTDT